jgi:hypothetical protein
MQNDLFPKNESNMPDRIWETYCCLVWCNNSLNVLAGRLRRNIPNEVVYVERAQSVISFLLKESGRLDEFLTYTKRTPFDELFKETKDADS